MAGTSKYLSRAAGDLTNFSLNMVKLIIKAQSNDGVLASSPKTPNHRSKELDDTPYLNGFEGTELTHQNRLTSGQGKCAFFFNLASSRHCTESLKATKHRLADAGI
jgi:hypothetical protein